MGVIYKITNLINGKAYVGKTSQSDWRVRWSQHKDFARNLQKRGRGDAYLYRAMRKHGVENFKIEVIDTAEAEETLCLKEIEWIAKLGTHDRRVGYNSTFGGESGKPTPDTLAKRIGVKRSPEAKANMSKAQKGRIVNEATRSKLSSIIKGRPVSPERAAAMKANPPGLGTRRTPEQKARMSAAIKASWTPERRARMSEMRKRSQDSNPCPRHIPTPEESLMLAQITRERWNNMTAEDRRRSTERLHAGLRRKPPTPEQIARRTEAVRRAWTPEKRAAWAQRLRDEGAIERIRGKANAGKVA